MKIVLDALYTIFGAPRAAVFFHKPVRTLAGALISAALLAGCAAVPEVAPEAAFPDPPERVISEEKKPLPEAPDERDPPVIVYTIEPAPRVQDGLGYVQLEYFEDADGNTDEEKPRIAVGLGRREIEHADTEWYTFTYIIDGTRYVKEGRHSVPYVRGKDGLWWNEATMSLPFRFAEELAVVVTDRYARKEYRFQVKRTLK